MRRRAGAVCVPRYSPEPKKKKKVGKQQPGKTTTTTAAANRELGLSAERQGLFSGGRAAAHQGHAAVIPEEEVLEIPNSEDGPRRWRYEKLLLLQFSICVFWRV